MTPDQARELLDGATPGEWQWDETGNVAAVDGDGWEDVADYVSEGNAALIVAAPDMAAMIAGMHAKYGVEVQRANGDWLPPYSWHDSPEQARTCVTALHSWPARRRIVRRYVTEPEAVE